MKKLEKHLKKKLTIHFMMSEPVENQTPRWVNRRQYHLSCIGYVVGLGNFWRFPWLVKENGGGAFLIAYAVMFALVGIPLLFLELAVGRLMRKSLVSSWKKISNFAIGLGVASVVVSFMVSTYYVVVITWCFSYFINSFQYPLPWSNCPKENVDNISRYKLECSVSDSVEYYWYRRTLNISQSINEGWNVHTDLVLIFVSIWITLFVSLFKGIKSAGKVVYFTAIFPYLALVILLLRGSFMDGAIEHGLKHFITPQWYELSRIAVWYDAATQVLFSLGISFGVWTTYSSFCVESQNILFDTLFIAGADFLSSILGALVIFQILGFRATKKLEECLRNGTSVHDRSKHVNFQNTTCNAAHFIEETTAGSGLAFIGFSESIISLPGSPFFSVLFFLLLVALGIDSMFGMIEVTVNLVREKLNQSFQKSFTILPLVVICVPLMLIGVTMLTGAGAYVTEMIVVYGSNYPILIIAFFETFIIAWVYGARKFRNDIKKTCKQSVSLFFVGCWYVISPLLMAGVLGVQLYTNIKTKPTFDTWNKYIGQLVKSDYPDWAFSVAILLCVIPLIPLPIGIIYGCREHLKIRKYKINFNGENVLVTSV